MNKKELEKSLIEAFKPLFDLYPELETVPVYAWGRYYKYECAGEEFESCISDFCDIHILALMCQRNFSSKQLKLFKKIDSIENVKGGRLYTCEIGDFLPDRSDCVKIYEFDSRAGRCLIINKTENGFEVECVKCDSPE